MTWRQSRNMQSHWSMAGSLLGGNQHRRGQAYTLNTQCHSIPFLPLIVWDSQNSPHGLDLNLSAETSYQAPHIKIGGQDATLGSLVRYRGSIRSWRYPSWADARSRCLRYYAVNRFLSHCRKGGYLSAVGPWVSWQCDGQGKGREAKRKLMGYLYI